MKTDLIKNIIKENNGIITAREIKSHNIDSWYLTDMIRKGELERVSRGIYFDPMFNNFDELFFTKTVWKMYLFLSDRIVITWID